MRSIRVAFDDGETMETNINGTDADIRKYYIGQQFVRQDEITFQTGVAVEFLDMQDHLSRNLAFITYARSKWCNIGRENGKWYFTSDPGWSVKEMAKEGWNVRLTGENKMLPDDTFRDYFEVL